MDIIFSVLSVDVQLLNCDLVVNKRLRSSVTTLGRPDPLYLPRDHWLSTCEVSCMSIGYVYSLLNTRVL